MCFEKKAISDNPNEIEGQIQIIGLDDGVFILDKARWTENKTKPDGSASPVKGIPIAENDET